MKLVEAATPGPAGAGAGAPGPSRQRPPAAPRPAAPSGAFEPPTRSSQTFEALDRALHAAIGRTTRGISPIVLARAYVDWLVHLGLSPGKQAQLIDKAARKALRFALYAARAAKDPATPPCIEPLPQDHRFDHPAWRQPPFDLIQQSFLLIQQWWHNATTGLRGMPRQERDVLEFAGRQLLDLLAPSNFVPTNPEALRTTVEHGGANLVQGALNFIEDCERAIAGKRPLGAEKFIVGTTVAATPARWSTATG